MYESGSLTPFLRTESAGNWEIKQTSLVLQNKPWHVYLHTQKHYHKSSEESLPAQVEAQPAFALGEQKVRASVVLQWLQFFPKPIHWPGWPGLCAPLWSAAAMNPDPKVKKKRTVCMYICAHTCLLWISLVYNQRSLRHYLLWKLFTNFTWECMHVYIVRGKCLLVSSAS